jgi:hypothetical protein
VAQRQAAAVNLLRLSFDYHHFLQMVDWLRQVSAAYPEITSLYSIGKSTDGRDLWVMVVSSSPYENMIGDA